MIDLGVDLGPVRLSTPLVAASGTFGSVVEFAEVADLRAYGALTVKSVAPEPWPGNPPPRLAPLEAGMLNAIGIQNPGIGRWVEEVAPELARLDVPVWGSAVAHDPVGFATVAEGFADAGLAAVEVNLSCPNLDGELFALDPAASAEVVARVRSAVDLPVGVKLSPDASDVVAVAEAVVEAGADWLVLTNTARGTAVDPRSGEPLVARGAGGISGTALRPIALGCVRRVAEHLDVPIVGCGGVSTGRHVLEYLRAGATAVALGTVHFEHPRAALRILRELRRELRRLGVAGIGDLVAS